MMTGIRGGFRWPRLRVRLLLSYLVVLLVAGVTFDLAVGHVAPDAFDAAMGHAMGAPMAGISDAAGTVIGQSFDEALAASVVVGLVAAGLVAMIVAVALAGRIMRPVDRLTAAGRRIADGRYAERVEADPADEIKALAASFNRMADRLEVTERERVRLVGDVAHELRTPLMTLQGYVEGLEDGVFAPDGHTWSLLHHETLRLSELVNDLQELWRAEAGQEPMALGPIDASSAVRSVIERQAGPATARRVKLVLDGAPPGATAAADARHLGQILDNLVSNAVRFSPEGGHVRIRVDAEGDDIIFVIADDGPGLTLEQRTRVFERFYRADPSRSRELGGSGVGLSLARALAIAMGGRLWVESAGPGQGSTFRLALPSMRADGLDRSQGGMRVDFPG